MLTPHSSTVYAANEWGICKPCGPQVPPPIGEESGLDGLLALTSLGFMMPWPSLYSP